ncbi:MAG: adenylyl-sulfate kinase [Bacteroidales bacterium]|nr:adenylyl-sulfate kinase [Bacteroidales bacterium]MBN2757684.1 adenylyl-sulfate kinase [Bacteroidales bacterium]
MPENIFPVFDRILQKEDKEKLLKQKAKVIWFTGLSGSGKTTLGLALEKELFNKGFLTQILDGDNIRSGINNNLTFTREDRRENIRRIAEVSKLFVNCGIIAINGFISPTDNMRNIAKEIIGAENYIEIFVNAPIEVCEKRDVKGLYEKARKGLIPNFTGISSPYEIPKNPDVEVCTDKLTIQESVDKILKFILPLIEYRYVKL